MRVLFSRVVNKLKSTFRQSMIYILKRLIKFIDPGLFIRLKEIWNSSYRSVAADVDKELILATLVEQHVRISKLEQEVKNASISNHQYSQ